MPTPQELAKFSDLAHRWWDPTSEFKPLHQINPLRLRWIDDTAGLKGKSVLDVGCGGGILAEAMAALGAHVKGIDLSDKALKVALLHLFESHLEVSYDEISAEDLAQREPGSTTCSPAWKCWSTCPIRPARSTPAPSWSSRADTYSLHPQPKSQVLCIRSDRRRIHPAPAAARQHDYAKFLKPSELARYCRAAGLTLQSVIGMSYNPLTKVYSLNNDTSVNYLMHCVRDA